MRILGYIEHPVMKITIFKMDNKFSVKFETKLYEQSYKFRESDELTDLVSIQTLIDDNFQAQVLQQFQQLHQIKTAALSRFFSRDEEDEFEEII